MAAESLLDLEPNSTGPSGTEPVVVFENVSIRFDGPPVLDQVTFQVAYNETRILLGPAGVGKSVLLKLCLLYTSRCV